MIAAKSMLAAMASLSFVLCQSSFAQQSTAPASPQKGLAGFFSSSKEDELIEPDLAFKLKVAVNGPSALTAELIPANGYYLYKDKVRFAVKNASGVTISSIKLPPGVMKIDQMFGKTEVYRTPILAEIALARTSKANNITLVASYQGCHEKAGVCYPPIEKILNLVLP
jgi:thiol:disulfide interchange protein